MKKKILTAIFACVLVAVAGVLFKIYALPHIPHMVSINIWVYEDFRYWILEDGTIEVVSYIGDEPDIVIPSEIAGRKVTSVGSCLVFTNTKVKETSVTIPDSVTSIKKQAFMGGRWLTEITIPDSVTDIGGAAFRNCESLTSITIPDGVTRIEADTFINCKSLESMTIPDSVTYIGERAFYNCPGMKSVTIGNNVREIGDEAFGFVGDERGDGESKAVPGFKIYCYEDTPGSGYASRSRIEHEFINDTDE